VTIFNKSNKKLVRNLSASPIDCKVKVCNKNVTSHIFGQFCHRVLFCFLKPIFWDLPKYRDRSRGFLTSEPGGHAPTIETRRRTSSPCPPGWPDPHPGSTLTPSLAIVTDPLLFLLARERTHNYIGNDQRLLPWWLCCHGESKVRSAS